MAQEVSKIVTATKPDHLTLIPRTHMVKEKNWLWKLSSDLHENIVAHASNKQTVSKKALCKWKQVDTKCHILYDSSSREGESTEPEGGSAAGRQRLLQDVLVCVDAMLCVWFMYFLV